ncbi:MAG TPA: hypothetical protein VKT77_01730 [Chthonomonadaceae bacterium]|nr:hypothetical protein [Chthonomonadaceae bacterium]
MADFTMGTHEKAHKFNLDTQTHGSFAEIGAGQEVARWFFHVGGAARTVAKSISAYDMAVSDALYGRAQRYVSRQRLNQMLDLEYAQLIDGLGPSRGATTTFFSFADTVATRRPGHAENGRGWVGLRFQTRPFESPSEIILHVHLMDTTAALQQEALGTLGINLVFGAFYHNAELPVLVNSLMDDLSRDRIEIDVMKVSGPAFEGADNRLLSLQLVEQGISDATMFTAAGEVVQVSEVTWKRPILVVRGSFRPATKLTIDLIDRARERFLAEPEQQGKEPIVLAEMTLDDLGAGSGISHEDFLARAQILHVLGIDVLVTRFNRFYQLAEYLDDYTDQMIGIAVGVPTLRKILDEQFCTEVGGGALESVGRLFRRLVKMYVYPTFDAATGRIITLDDAEVQSPLHHIRDFLLDQSRLEAIPCPDPEILKIRTPDVRGKIEDGDPSWEASVPPVVADIVKAQRLFGYREGEASR